MKKGPRVQYKSGWKSCFVCSSTCNNQVDQSLSSFGGSKGCIALDQATNAPKEPCKSCAASPWQAEDQRTNGPETAVFSDVDLVTQRSATDRFGLIRPSAL